MNEGKKFEYKVVTLFEKLLKEGKIRPDFMENEKQHHIEKLRPDDKKCF